MKQYSYSDRLKLLKLDSLELRRLYIDLVMCYKIILGLVDVNSDDFFQFSLSTNTRSRQYKLNEERRSKRAINSFFLPQRVVNVWNCLPSDVIDFTCLASFKRTIELVDYSVFLKSSF